MSAIDTTSINSFSPASNQLEINEDNIQLFGDSFNSPPNGYDQRIWEPQENSTNTIWNEDDFLVFDAVPNTHCTMKSKLELNTEVYVIGPDSPTVTYANGLISDFNFTFTGGQTYFGIGWVDLSSIELETWTGNYRDSENGIFIDYWDNRIHLVTCSEGQASVTVLPQLYLYDNMNFRLIWRESTVILLINNEIQACLYENIPNDIMPFAITTAGFDHRVGIDQLKIDHVGVYTFGYPDISEAPLPLLLWPHNGSTVLATQEIIFDILGGVYDMQYSWDYGGWYEKSEPWIISIPDEPGQHLLQIAVENFIGEITSQTYYFTVENGADYLGTYEMSEIPHIDGNIESWEKSSGTESSALFMQDDRTLSSAELVTGFLNGSLYFGLETQIHDGLYTSMTMYVDSDGSGSWGDVSKDFLLKISAPSDILACEEIIYADGTNISLHDARVQCNSSTKNDMLCLEIMLNTNVFHTDSSENIYLGLRIEQGGISNTFPATINHVGQIDLVRIEHLGERPISPLSYAGIFIGVGFVVIGVISLSYRRSKYRRRLITHPVREEKLERVLTLVSSYPRARVDRLRKMSGLESEEFDSALLELVKQRVIEVEITSEGEIIRKQNNKKYNVSGMQTGKW